MKCRISVVLVLACLCLAMNAFAESFSIKPNDTIQKVLEASKGKRIELRLVGGGELSGKVRLVTNELVQLGELSGREFFDGVIEIGKITAVIVRVKEK